jgi:hypothetical protein
MWNTAMVVAERLRELAFTSLTAAGCSGMGVGITVPSVAVCRGDSAVRLTARERVEWRQLAGRLSRELTSLDSPRSQ